MMRHLMTFCLLAGGLVFVAACSKPAAPPKPAATAPDDHDHGNGPHGGAMAEWDGGKYHAEFTVDHGKKETVVYLLGEDAKTPAPVKAETLFIDIDEPAFRVELVASPLEGETAGASRYVGQHENLGIVREFSGSIEGQIDGKPLAGEFQEVAN